MIFHSLGRSYLAKLATYHCHGPQDEHCFVFPFDASRIRDERPRRFDNIALFEFRGGQEFVSIDNARSGLTLCLCVLEYVRRRLTSLFRRCLSKPGGIVPHYP